MAKILVVEDEDNIAVALEFLLTRDGHDQKRMPTGVGVVEIAREWKPDLILLDVMLPEVSGYQIVEAMRKDEALRDMPVLMMTARGSTVERQKGLALGASGFIAKPFELAELRAEIAQLIDR